MKRIDKTSLIFRMLRQMVIASLLTSIIGAQAGEGSTVMIGPNSISTAAVVADAISIELRVAGPDGFYAAQQSSTGTVDWYPGSLPDGEYRYEVFVTVGDIPEEGESHNTQLYHENGRFKVESGVLSPAEFEPTSMSPDEQAVQSNSWITKLANALIDFLLPSAEAADLTVSSTLPRIDFDDTTTVNGDQWTLFGLDSSFFLRNYAGDNLTISERPFEVFPDTPILMRLDHNSFDLWSFETDQRMFLISSSAVNALEADSGHLSLADGMIYVDKIYGNVGIGTVAPFWPLHLVSDHNGIFLDNTVGGDIGIENSNGELMIRRANAADYNGIILTLENDLTDGIYPGVGIWEADPDTPLHVESHDGMSAKLLVKNPSAPTAAGDVNMFALDNSGSKIVRFSITAGGDNSIWTFDNEPTYNGGAGVNSGRFRIAKSGTGVPEFTVDGYGHGRFYGNSYAVNHVNTSSREAKTDFQALDERDVLAKLMQLPLAEWRYKQESQDTRHIGPVAEDFQKVFGLGDGKHISTVDSEGVALAAIKAIKAETDILRQEKDAEIEKLRAEKNAQIKILTNRLKDLEELVSRKHQVSRR